MIDGPIAIPQVGPIAIIRTFFDPTDFPTTHVDILPGHDEFESIATIALHATVRHSGKGCKISIAFGRVDIVVAVNVLATADGVVPVHDDRIRDWKHCRGDGGQ